MINLITVDLTYKEISYIIKGLERVTDIPLLSYDLTKNDKKEIDLLLKRLYEWRKTMENEIQNEQETLGDLNV